MTRIFSRMALGTALVILVSPADIFAGRGGGYRGGGGGGGGYRGGGGGYGGGGGAGHYGGGMGGSPSFSQARQSTGQSGAHPYGSGSGAANSSHPGAAAGAVRVMPTTTTRA